jgi:hypothetical protein
MEGSGEKEFRAATAVICDRMASRDAGWKRRRSLSSVISRVFDGGVGWDSGGRLDRSSVRDGRDEDREDEDDDVECEHVMPLGGVDIPSGAMLTLIFLVWTDYVDWKLLCKQIVFKLMGGKCLVN